MKQVTLSVKNTMALSELVALVSDAVDHEDIAKFIALLEASYEDWKVTEQLLKHFEALKEDYKEVFTPTEQDLTPFNLIKTKK